MTYIMRRHVTTNGGSKQRVVQGEIFHREEYQNETVIHYGKTRVYQNNKEGQENRRVTLLSTRLGT
jgi:hypothetical protein